EDPDGASGTTGWTGSGGYQTTDRTLRRKTFVIQGITVDPSVGFPTLTTEWDIFPINTDAGIGSHSHSSPNIVTLTVTDANSNSSTCQSLVTVQDNIAPAITCPANVTSATSSGGTGDCNGTASWTAPVGTDNCNGATTMLVTSTG